MNSRISLTPESFATGPLLSLVPPVNTTSGNTLDSLRALQVALFSRFEQLEKQPGNDREQQMLKIALDWCALPEESEE